MICYDISDDSEFNTAMQSLDTFRIRTMEIDCHYHVYIVVGECDSIPNTKIILNIKDRSLFKNLIDSVLDNE